MPSEGAVGAAHMELDLVGLAGCDRAGPQLEAPGQIVGADGRSPFPSPKLLGDEAGVLVGAGVLVVERAIRLGGPDHVRQRLAQDAEPPLALPQRLLGPLVPGDGNTAGPE